MVDYEKIVKGLEVCANNDEFCSECSYSMSRRCRTDLLMQTIGLIRKQAEQLEPQDTVILDLETILREDKVVWVEWIGCNAQSLQPTAVKSHGDFSVAFWNGEVHPKGLYGKQWRCWNRKPTDEQREAVKWE